MTARASQAAPRMTTIPRGIKTEMAQSDEYSKTTHKALSRDMISFFGRRRQNHSALCNSSPFTELFIPRCWVRSVSGGMSGYNVRRESSPSLNGFHIFINLPFLAIRLYPPDAQSHPEVYMVTRKVAPTPQKGIREFSTCRERSSGTANSDVPRHKNDSRGRADDLKFRLICSAWYSGCCGEPTFTANKGIVYSLTPPF